MDILKKYNQYLKGQMSEEELDDFTKAIIKEPMQAETLKNKWGGLLENDQEFQALKKEILQREQTATIKKLPVKNNRRQIMSIAAGLLLLIAAGFLIFNNSDTLTINTLASQQLESPFSYQDSRGGAIEGDDLRIKASDQYRAGNFTAAAPLFEQLTSTSNFQNSDQFYLGLSQLYSGNYSAAAQQLEVVKNASGFELSKEAGWYLSLALVQAGEMERAKIELGIIANRNGWKSAEARELLEAME